MVLSNHQNRKYKISEYDPSWISQYEKIKRFITEIVANNLVSIHHVGSTAIPSMVGKPTIDVLVLVESLKRVKKQKMLFKKKGYTLIENYFTDNYLIFAKEHKGNRLENIHITTKGHPKSLDMLKLKQFLLTHPSKVVEYTLIKKRLTTEFPDDYAEYRKRKDFYLKKLVSEKVNPWSEQMNFGIIQGKNGDYSVCVKPKIGGSN